MVDMANMTGLVLCGATPLEVLSKIVAFTSRVNKCVIKASGRVLEIVGDCMVCSFKAVRAVATFLEHLRRRVIPWHTLHMGYSSGRVVAHRPRFDTSNTHVFFGVPLITSSRCMHIAGRNQLAFMEDEVPREDADVLTKTYRHTRHVMDVKGLGSRKVSVLDVTTHHQGLVSLDLVGPTPAPPWERSCVDERPRKSVEM